MRSASLPLLFVIGAIGALGITAYLFSASPFAIAAQATAVRLGIWARRSFWQGTFRVTAAPAGRLIIREGPYRFVRHPMYSAALLIVWAAVISHASGLTLALGATVTCLTVARVFAEERLLAARFPDYPNYARSTKALIPLVF